MPRLLTGAELRAAAEKGLPVRYVERTYDPHEPNFDAVVTMTKANVGYYIGHSDIDPDDFEPDAEVALDWPEGTGGVYAVRGVKYTCAS
jgi:hypothetical protein